ncbi:DivIVA domain-containing protein [uncultured Microbacterium sp.]|uniref:DivIVA domain-containing protein n=1 Tax=uncultured Microbacterium sp. TaxID=191216 RepID=UPI0025CBB22B|nr:DivIVA domain-containing protein [uncultured Microbacterium sp.]
MALTPDDVVTKQFQHVRFKEGFDPEEVDDFLDEIVVEWRKALAENEELKAKIAELESGAAAAPASVATPAPAPVVEEAPAPAAAPVVASGAASSSAGIIELAQRVHDEHVADGIAQRDKLVADAQAQASRIIADAETKQNEALAKLERDRAVLEGKIGELQEFERTYRSQLRSYIEGQLQELDSASAPSGKN